MKLWIFDNSFQKKVPVFVILVPSTHQEQEVLWSNSAFEAVEAIEVAEVGVVKEAAEVPKPEKSLLRN